MIIVHILTIVLFGYLAATLLYLFMLALAGRFGRLKAYTAVAEKSRIAVLIPSYREDNIIVHTASQALLQDYPADRYSVTVIADQLKPETIAALRALPVGVVEVTFQKSMKARSLHAAFNQLPPGEYDLVMVLDADNIMAAGCLEKVNAAFRSGWNVIQCHRTAKNKNTPVAVLDALSEEVNNTMFRRGQRALGLSCALIGSGMAFRYDLLKAIFSLPQILDNPGEDREVDIQLVKQGFVVEYLEDAYVYDEKVQRKEVFEKQRTRWLATQVDHLKRFLAPDMRSHFGKRIYTHKLFQCLFLPRLLLLLLFVFLVVLCAVDIWFTPGLLFPVPGWWLGLMGLYAATLFAAVPAAFYNRDTFRALLQLPVLMFSMVKALLKIGKNKKGFLHTPKEFSQ
ncbi:MAG TPA: glycosyltransferase family 2 protein [Puia sp.]|nr:glycosyltransferase family 2 protein [Puia sp.]